MRITDQEKLMTNLLRKSFFWWMLGEVLGLYIHVYPPLLNLFWCYLVFENLQKKNFSKDKLKYKKKLGCTKSKRPKA